MSFSWLLELGRLKAGVIDIHVADGSRPAMLVVVVVKLRDEYGLLSLLLAAWLRILLLASGDVPWTRRALIVPMEASTMLTADSSSVQGRDPPLRMPPFGKLSFTCEVLNAGLRASVLAKVCIRGDFFHYDPVILVFFGDGLLLFVFD